VRSVGQSTANYQGGPDKSGSPCFFFEGGSAKNDLDLVGV
jgi:hypothetical protein